MKIPARQIDQYLWDPELSARKMVFLSGPRQAGKTTYAKTLLSKRPGVYLNWDNPAVRRAYTADPFFFLADRPGDADFLAVFDEVHKRPRWKDILKGIYDSVEPSVRILVTGSARLEWFRRSGDSLVGRYVHFHMMPLSIAEVQGTPLGDVWLGNTADKRAPFRTFERRLLDGKRGTRAIYDHLFVFGGFPEPFARGSERFLRTWRRDYLSLLLREDLRDLTNIRTVDTVETLAELLPERIGSPLSVNGLAGDLEVSFPTVKNHLMQLERLWLLFSLRPYSHRLNRTLKKERKTYFLNWIYAAGEARQFENLVATALLRATLIWTDLGLADAELWYVRGFDGGEIDFLITLDGKPALLVEAKLNNTEIDRRTRTLAGRVGVPLIQVVHRGGILRQEQEATLVSADRFLAVLP